MSASEPVCARLKTCCRFFEQSRKLRRILKRIDVGL